jgi:hypothetical protein
MRPLADELSRSRSQMLRQRDRNIPIRAADKNRIGPDNLARIEKGEWQAIILTDGPSEGVINEVSSKGFPNENFGFNSVLTTDIEKGWGFVANAPSDTSRTATEVATQDRAKDVRLDMDRQAVLDWFIKTVEKFACLPLLFADEERIVEWEGEDGAKKLATWNKDQIQGRYAYSIAPDSSVRINAAEKREMELRFINLVANNPYFNQKAVADDMARSFNKDPAVVCQIPPQKEEKPEPPKLSMSIKGDDLNPAMPQYINVVAVLTQLGITGFMPPQPVALEPDVVPPGANVVKAASGRPPVSKHHDDLTGKLPGPGPM